MEIGSRYGEEQINEVCVYVCVSVRVCVCRDTEQTGGRGDGTVVCLCYCLVLSPPPLSFSLTHSPLHLLLSLFWRTETAVDSSHLSGVATTLQASRPTMDVFSVNTRLKISLPSHIQIPKRASSTVEPGEWLLQVLHALF